jgi:DNA-binding NarL/FixJ family response regulator
MGKGHTSSGRRTFASGSPGQCDQDRHDIGSASAPPRIYITSEICLFREGISVMLARESRVDVVGCGSGSEALAEIGKLRPELALLDMTGDDCLALPRKLRGILPALRVVGVAVSGLGADVIACAEAGICGYVAQDGNVEHLIGTIMRALSGELVCPPQIQAMLFDRVATLCSGRPLRPSGPELTRREREIAAMIARGLQNKEIARRLCLGTATVKNHVHNILQKLKIQRRSEIFGQCFDVDPWGGSTGATGMLAGRAREPA